MNKKLVRPILVPTKSECTLKSSRINLILFEEKIYNPFKNQYYDLVLISLGLQERIEENDLYIHFNSHTNEYSLWLADEEFYDGNDPNILDIRSHVYPYWNKKVIVKQSQLSPELINQLLSEYNTTGRFEDFEIEMEEGEHRLVGMCGEEEVWTFYPDSLKLTNGFITPVEKENSFEDCEVKYCLPTLKCVSKNLPCYNNEKGTCMLDGFLDFNKLVKETEKNTVDNSAVQKLIDKYKNKIKCIENLENRGSSDNEIYYTKEEMLKLFNKYARKLSYEVFTNGIQTPSQSLDFTIKFFEQNKKK